MYKHVEKVSEYETILMLYFPRMESTQVATAGVLPLREDEVNHDNYTPFLIKIGLEAEAYNVDLF